MSKLNIYGIRQSRAYRTYWMAHELGLDYEAHPHTTADAKSDDYRKINPSAQIPAIDDDGFCLSQSMAINLYLARKHGGPLQPKSLQDEARAWQWSFWVMSDVEKPALDALFQAMAPEDKRNPEVTAKATQALQKPLGVLDGALADRSYLLGDEFTVADLNVAAVLSWAKMAKLDMTAYPKAKDWLDRCLARPAAKAARG